MIICERDMSKANAALTDGRHNGHAIWREYGRLGRQGFRRGMWYHARLGRARRTVRTGMLPLVSK